MPITVAAGPIMLADTTEMPDVATNFASGVATGCDDYYFKISPTHFSAVRMKGSYPIDGTSEVYALAPLVIPSGSLSGVSADSVKVGNVYWIVVASNSTTQSSVIFKFTPGVGISNVFSTTGYFLSQPQFDCAISPDGEYVLFSGGPATVGQQKTWLFRRTGNIFAEVSGGNNAYNANASGKSCSFTVDGYFVVGHTSNHFYAYRVVNGVTTDLGKIGPLTDANKLNQCSFDSTGTYLYACTPLNTASYTRMYKRVGNVFTDISTATVLLTQMPQFAKWGKGDLIFTNTNVNTSVLRFNRTTEVLTRIYANAWTTGANYCRAVLNERVVLMTAFVTSAKTVIHNPLAKVNSPQFGTALQTITVANSTWKFDFSPDAKYFERWLENPAVADNRTHIKGPANYDSVGPSETTSIRRAVSRDGKYRATLTNNRIWLWRWNPTSVAWDTDGQVLATAFTNTVNFKWLDTGYLAVFDNGANNTFLYRISKTAAQVVGGFELHQTLPTDAVVTNVYSSKNVLSLERLTNNFQECYIYNKTTKQYVANRNANLSNTYRISNGKWFIGCSTSALESIFIVTGSGTTNIGATNVGITDTVLIGITAAFTKDGRFFYYKRTSAAAADWIMYDTTTFPWTQVPNPFPQKSDFYTRPPDISDNYEAAVGMVSATTFSVYRSVDAESDYSLPAFAINGRTGNPNNAYPVLRYPVFGVSGRADIPLFGNGLLNYPPFSAGAFAPVYVPEIQVPINYAAPVGVTYVDVPAIGASNEAAPPHALSAYSYPTYGMSGLGSQPYFLDIVLNFPKYGLQGESNVPIGVLSILSYPIYSMSGFAPETETDNPTPIEFGGIQSTSTNIEGYSGLPNVAIAPPHTYGIFNYPRYGVQTEVKLADYAQGVLGYSGYSLNATDTIFLYTDTELGYPVYGVSGESVVARRSFVELDYPVYGLEADVPMSASSDINLGYPALTVRSEGGSPADLETILTYPVFGTDGRVNETAHGTYELGYPVFGFEGFVITDDREVNGEMTFPAFGMSGEIFFNTAVLVENIYPVYGIQTESGVIIPDAGLVDYTYPVYGLQGDVNIPIAVLSAMPYPVFGSDGLVEIPDAGEGIMTYPAYVINAEVIPTYKIPDMSLGYPKFGIEGLSGYPDRVFIALPYPKFGVSSYVKGANETVEAVLNYPAFGVRGTLESYIAVRLEMSLGKVEIESEVSAFKPNRRTVIIRR